MEPEQRQFSLWYFVVGLITLFALQSVFFAPHRETLAYSEFKALAKQGKVSDLLFERQQILGTVDLEGAESVLSKVRVDSLRRMTKGPHPFTTTRVDDPGLVPELEKAGVRFAARAENPWSAALLSWVLPAVVLFAL